MNATTYREAIEQLARRRKWLTTAAIAQALNIEPTETRILLLRTQLSKEYAVDIRDNNGTTEYRLRKAKHQ